MNEDYDFLQILVVVGAEACGKTALMNAFVSDSFTLTDNYTSTIGFNFYTKTVNVDDHNVKLQLWDTAGQLRFRHITEAYYRGAHGILLVYDVTKRESFDDLVSFMDKITTMCLNIRVVLIGNKADCNKVRNVCYEEAKCFAAKYDRWIVSVIETSARTGQNVEMAMISLVTHHYYFNH